MKYSHNSNYEKYPLQQVVFRNILNILTILTGCIILNVVDTVFVILYLVYYLFFIIWSLYFRCKFCYYYGKRCASGFGLIVPFFFKKGSEYNFIKNNKYSLPIIVFFIAPTIASIYLLFTNFSYSIVILQGLLIVLCFGLARVYYIRYGCRQCKQKDKCNTYKVSLQK